MLCGCYLLFIGRGGYCYNGL